MSEPALQSPSAPQFFDRLAHLAHEMTLTCGKVEETISGLNDEISTNECATLQDLDRMTQNLIEVSKLLTTIAQSDSQIPAADLAKAIASISLPSLKTYISSGDAQDDRGDVDLF